MIFIFLQYQLIYGIIFPKCTISIASLYADTKRRRFQKNEGNAPEGKYLIPLSKVSGIGAFCARGPLQTGLGHSTDPHHQMIPIPRRIGYPL